MEAGRNVRQSTSTVCVDANTVVFLFTEQDGGASRAFWKDLHDNQSAVVAPALLRYEITNAFHRMSRARVLSEGNAADFLQSALDLPIAYRDAPELLGRAMSFAKRFDRPDAYDACYLGLAESLAVDFWTADKRLYNSVSDHLPWVHLVSE
jgi:predicted nucleic acid-binding protein